MGNEFKVGDGVKLVKSSQIAPHDENIIKNSINSITKVLELIEGDESWYGHCEMGSEGFSLAQELHKLCAQYTKKSKNIQLRTWKV